MSRLYEQLIKKFYITKQTSISMRLRLFLFLSVLVLTMAAGIVIILLVTGTFTAGMSESRQLIRNELTHASSDISAQFGELSVQAVDFSTELSQRIDASLAEQGIPFYSLTDHPEQIEALISDLYEETYYSLQKAKCSGAFFILDTSVNTSLPHSEYTKAGLYLKNMEPNVVSATMPTFTLLRGFSSIGRRNSVNLHTQWSMEFDVSEADYYYSPIELVTNNPDLDSAKLYYWSEPFVLPGTSEEVMTCTIPIVDAKNNVYGVCGFDISTMLFKLSHMPTNSTYSRILCMLAPMENSNINISSSMFAGGYTVKDISKDITNLQVKNSDSSFTTYTGNNGNTYLGYYTPTQLYPKGSPLSGRDWITAVLVPKEDVIASVMRIKIILICLLSLLVTGGIIISIVVSNKYLKPISQGIEMIKYSDTEEIPKTKVQEIDDLVQYLAQYKTELSKKLEQENYQISILQEFVSRTKTLTPAEHSVFSCYSKGMSANEIAGELFLSINTIKSHSKHIFAKLNVASREELLLYIRMLKEIGLELK